MISLIVVALVGIGFTRLTMLALELRDNYEDGPNDGPADMTRKRVDAHNRMVSMPKPAEMILKGDNRYEPKSSKADFKGEGTYSSVLASTEATLQAGFNAIFNYGPVEQKPSSYQGGPSAGDEGAKGAREANSEEEADDVERTNAEPSQSSVLIDPTVRMFLNLSRSQEWFGTGCMYDLLRESQECGNS